VAQKWQEEHAIKGSTMSHDALSVWVALLLFSHLISHLCRFKKKRFKTVKLGVEKWWEAPGATP
jgi:hypothetical protein